MSPTRPLCTDKRHGLAIALRAHEYPIQAALLAPLVICCPALAIAGKLDKVVTSLRWSAKDTLSGSYVLTDQDGETKGRLKDCKPLRNQLLKCVWIDKYGYGDLELNFDDSFTEFYGEWRYFGGGERYVWDGAKKHRQ